MHIQTANTHRLTLLTSLSSTLSALSFTPVPTSIHQTPHESHSPNSSSLFGSNAGLSNKGDLLDSRTVEGEQSSGKNLRDFIDELGMDALMDALDEEQGEIDVRLTLSLSLPSFPFSLALIVRPNLNHHLLPHTFFLYRRTSSQPS